MLSVRKVQIFEMLINQEDGKARFCYCFVFVSSTLDQKLSLCGPSLSELIVFLAKKLKLLSRILNNKDFSTIPNLTKRKNLDFPLLLLLFSVELEIYNICKIQYLELPFYNSIGNEIEIHSTEMNYLLLQFFSKVKNS